MDDNSRKRKGKEIVNVYQGPRKLMALDNGTSRVQLPTSDNKSNDDSDSNTLSNNGKDKVDQKEYDGTPNNLDENGVIGRDEWVRQHSGPRDPRKVLEAAFQEYKTYYSKPPEKLSPTDRRELKGETYRKWRNTLHKYYDVIVFTDASKAAGIVGYGVYYGYQDSQNSYGPVLGDQRVANAEVYAVLKALLADEHIYSSLRIETDCMGVLTDIQKRLENNPDCRFPHLCDKIITLLSMRPGPISLGYAPSYVGIFGSDVVNQVAKYGARIAAGRFSED